MIVVLQAGTTRDEREALAAELRGLGLEVRALEAGGKPLLHVVSGPTRRARRILRRERVEALVPTSGPRIRRSGNRIYPYYLVIWSGAGVLLFGIVVFLAGLFTPGSGPPVDVEHPPETLSWPWYLRGLRAFLLLFPPERRWLGWLALSVAGTCFALLPVLDRPGDDPRERRWPVVGAACALVAALLLFGLAGGVS